ncbi:MAG: hypothetical protein M1815_003036 [Lichina confinis]|nr:MAG: hypothetical protein M1815_003036 [Lichina confinis]
MASTLFMSEHRAWAENRRKKEEKAKEDLEAGTAVTEMGAAAATTNTTASPAATTSPVAISADDIGRLVDALVPALTPAPTSALTPALTATLATPLAIASAGPHAAHCGATGDTCGAGGRTPDGRTAAAESSLDDPTDFSG